MSFALIIRRYCNCLVGTNVSVTASLVIAAYINMQLDLTLLLIISLSNSNFQVNMQLSSSSQKAMVHRRCSQ